MANFIEPYAKENNILQLSLFYFGKGRPQRSIVTWEDEIGDYQLECMCKYGVPGSFDQDVYTACMRIWVKQGMPSNGIKLNYSDIARELALEPRDWNGKIKKALKKLAQARYEFTKCFIKADKNGNKRINTHFSLFDSASLFVHERGKSKRNSESQLVFPEVIKENLEAKYYQLLDMVWYRALPQGISRRLYEYLAKRRYHSVNGALKISEAVICRWLPITTKNTTVRRKTLKKAADSLITSGFLSSYIFDTKKKICLFTYSKKSRPQGEKDTEFEETEVIGIVVDKTSKVKHNEVTREQQCLFVDALDWIDSIPYFHKKRRKEIAALPISQVAQKYSKVKQEYDKLEEEGKKPKPNWIYACFLGEKAKMEKAKSQENSPKPGIDQLELFGEEKEAFSPEKLEELLLLIKLKRITAKLKKLVSQYYEINGYEYVKSNILYTNKNAKTSYIAYLTKALEADWAEEWREQTLTIQKQNQVIEEEIEERRKVGNKEKVNRENIKKEWPLFMKSLEKLDRKIKQKLWKQAQKQIPQEHARREKMVGIEYSKLIIQYMKYDEVFLKYTGPSNINKIVQDLHS